VIERYIRIHRTSSEFINTSPVFNYSEEKLPLAPGNCNLPVEASASWVSRRRTRNIYIW